VAGQSPICKRTTKKTGVVVVALVLHAEDRNFKSHKGIFIKPFYIFFNL
jgi:hypothetical protein